MLYKRHFFHVLSGATYNHFTMISWFDSELGSFGSWNQNNTSKHVKAFDKVSHSRLIYKLKLYGFSNDIITWIQDFLKDRKFRVRVNASYSTWDDVTSDLPQGSVFRAIVIPHIYKWPGSILRTLLWDFSFCWRCKVIPTYSQG